MNDIDDYMSGMEIIVDNAEEPAKKSLSNTFNMADKAYKSFQQKINMFIRAQKKLNEGDTMVKSFAQILNEAKKVKVVPQGKGESKSFRLMTPSGDELIDMFFDSEEAAKKYAKKKGYIVEMTAHRREAENQKAMKRIQDFWDRSKGDEAKFSAQINLRTKKMTKKEKVQIWASELENQNHHDEAEVAFKRLKELGG